MTNFPIIISCGASQLSLDWYSETLSMPKDTIKLFPEVVAEKLGGYSHNVAVPGLSNRKILRKALYECIKQLETNPEQRTIVLIELTFDLRKDLWITNPNGDNVAGDSDFVSFQIAQNVNWWENRLNRKVKDSVTDSKVNRKLNSMDQKYLIKWQQVEQYFYSPYAENINLIMDIINFTSFMKLNNIEYLIFRGNPTEQLLEEHLLDTFNSVISKDLGIFDLTTFSFTQWCVDRNFQPVDYQDRPTIGHPNLEAHNAFGLFLTEKIIENKSQQGCIT